MRKLKQNEINAIRRKISQLSILDNDIKRLQEKKDPLLKALSSKGRTVFDETDSFLKKKIDDIVFERRLGEPTKEHAEKLSSMVMTKAVTVNKWKDKKEILKKELLGKLPTVSVKYFIKSAS